MLSTIKVIFFVQVFCSLFIFSISTSNEEIAVEIDNPKFSEKGLDDKIYEIKADKGIKFANNLKLFIIEGKFKTENGTWIYLKADEGTYNQESNIIELNKNINFYTDEHESLKSDMAIFYISKDIIEFYDNVRHLTENTIVTSNNSKVINNFNNISYEGDVFTKFKKN